jgi:hypothetical protein
MTGSWRHYRPAIWLAMLSVAVMLLLSFAFGALFLGAAIGVAAKVNRGRRAATDSRTRPRRRLRG